ncbi:hypothetical protein [Lentilactobacillus kosonis]|uniref:Uncharacterized protein n=1 Tax=Lentilactobacillus kosonis TaxID=2810561 RepID=A0A401FK34_9LACO|nr:hypothetical protein [Lentilactobacillus kosonis]GAY72745.1 hypothetical protein NBRC111893_891 [Lentilactobacillus kosonis]
MSDKYPTFNENQWRTAQQAVINEYSDYINELQKNGVDYTIKNARKLLIYQDLLSEWKDHRLTTVITDLEDNPFALTVFNDLKKTRVSHLLKRGYQHIAEWPDFNPTPIALWLELQEDVSI